MPVRLTLHPGEDVELPDGARLGDVRAALARVVRRPELLHAALAVDDSAVRDDSVVGHRPLLPGATLRAVDDRADVASSDQEVAALRSPWAVTRATGPAAGEARPLGPGRPVALTGSAGTQVVLDRRGRPVVEPGSSRSWWHAPVLRPDDDRRTRRRGAAGPDASVKGTPGRGLPWQRVLWRRRWHPGDVLEVGGVLHTLRRSGDAAAVLAPPPDGPQDSVVRPAMLVVGAVPVIGSIALAVALRQPLYALFSLVGIATLVPQVGALVRRRRAGKDATAPVRRDAGADPGRTIARVTALHEISDGAWRSALARVAERARASAVPEEKGPAAGALVPDGAVAVRAPEATARAVARAIVVDLAATGAGVHVTGPGRDAWAWCRWLVTDRPGPRVLVVDGLDAPTSGLAVRAHRRGDVVVLCLPDHRDGTPAEVPAWCRARVTVRGAHLVRTAPDGATSVHPVVGVGVPAAERTARRLAGLRGLGRSLDDLDGARPGHPRTLPDDEDRLDPAADDLPRTVALAGLTPPVEPGAGWATSTGWSVPIGVGRTGPVHLDLVADGPHLLVAGTTGSGKSELLQSLVLGLALQRSPADLAFVLVDFKGGASFGRCADLPHVVGQVTDLEPGLAARALAGLRAELRRRERVLAAHRAASLDAAPPGTLPRLVVVIDEFRALADELPDFLPGLLRVAAQGRSLGVHLVLATQRPAGAIGADVRANISARIALRVVDAADSHDVVGTAVAALVPVDAPGRAVLRIGSADPVVVQCAHAGIPASDGPAVRRAEAWRWAGRRGDATPSVPAGTPDLVADAVATARRTAQALGLRPGPAPWLPALPERTSAADAGADVSPAAGSDGPADGPGESPAVHGLPLALADDPEHQRRHVVCWTPSSGHLAVVGRARSGRTTTLVSLARAALDRGWHVHALATPASTSAFEALRDHPGFGTLVGPDDPRRARRLLHLLTSPADGHPVLAVVDGVEELRAALAGADPWDPLTSALARGRAAFAVTSDSASVGGVAARTGPRLVMLGSEQHADVVLGAPSSLAGTGGPPGRAAWLTGAGSALCQVLLPGPAAVQHRELAGRSGSTVPVRLQALPEVVTSGDVERSGPAGGGSSGTQVVVGRGGDDAAPVLLDVEGGALVVGPRGSGRSNVLRQVVRVLEARGLLAGVVARDAALRAEAGTAPVADGSPATVRALLDRPASATRTGFLVVDDLDALQQSCPVEAERLTGGADPAFGLVASATTQGALMAHRGPLAELRGRRSGIVLVPAERGSDDVLGTPLTAAVDPGPPRPGRGAVVHRGRVVPVQTLWSGAGRGGAESGHRVLDHASGHEAHDDERGGSGRERPGRDRPDDAAGEQGEPDQQLEDLPADDDGTPAAAPSPERPGTTREHHRQAQEERHDEDRHADVRRASADQLHDDGDGEHDERRHLDADGRHDGHQQGWPGRASGGANAGLRALGTGHHP